MNGWIRSARDHHAVQRARQRRSAATAASDRHRDMRACTPRVRNIADQRVESARMLPTLRSMPPVRMTNVIASEMMPISEICRRMSVRLPACRKMREPSAAVGLISDGQDQDAEQRRQACGCAAARHQASGSATARRAVAAAMIVSWVASLAS